MITPISSAHPSEVKEAARRPEPKPEAPIAKSGAVSSDQVTLKSAGQIDHDGDGK